MVLRSTPRRLATPSMPRPLDRTAARSRSLVMWTPERTTWDELTVQQLPQEIQHGCCPVPARGRSLNLRLGGNWCRDERGPEFEQEGVFLEAAHRCVGLHLSLPGAAGGGNGWFGATLPRQGGAVAMPKGCVLPVH